MADFFAQKIKTLFTRFDMDKNGMIEVTDFNEWSAKLAKISGLSADRSAALTKSLLSVWNTYFLPADTNHDGSVEVPELVTYMKLALTDATKRTAIEATLPLIFDAVDSNLDNAIAADEFAAYFASLGINDSAFATQVFKSMDSNNDGVLSKDG
jgi:Ca2+-binding EF-hand superfamily protein